MISLVFLATVINYLDRQTLSVVAPTLMREFQMTNVTYSRIVFAFMLAYTVMNGVSGPMIDRMGTRLGYAVCMMERRHFRSRRERRVRRPRPAHGATGLRPYFLTSRSQSPGASAFSHTSPRDFAYG